MNSSPVTKIAVFLATMLSLFVCLLIFINGYFDERTKIVFCDVGQGDAIYIRIKNKADVLIDAGPDQKVLSCLGKYMPFWDRKIELIFISHNQKDHFGGINYILDRYQVGTVFLVNDLNASLQSFKRLKEKILNTKIKVEEAFAGKKIGLMDSLFTIIWPTRELVSNNDNDFSSVILFESNDVVRNVATFRALFTGDASSFILSRLSHGSLKKVDILKVPHHGSKNGLTKNFLDLADPKVAVISVGKNNSYGHPHKVVLDMLKAKNIKIQRTDEEGNIVYKIN
jgi:competence protein ComEC